MEAETSRSSGSADSYIGSPICLTSKSEIRYEGVLFNINTLESSIGLRNVRSFGSEGRKKDGPHIPPSDKVYEYILFRGSDIKDLQVKATPQVQTIAPIYNDPAIIESHYPRPTTAPLNLPCAGTGSLQDLSHMLLLGLHNPTSQGNLPLHQPSGSLGLWGSSLPPPTANANGLSAPMCWQGFYGASDKLQAQKQSLPQSPPSLSRPSTIQQSEQCPATNASLPIKAYDLHDSPPLFLPPFGTGNLNLHSSILPVQFSAVLSDSSTSLMSNKAAVQVLPPSALSTSLPLVSPLSTALHQSAITPEVPNKSKTVPDSVLPYNGFSESLSSVAGASNSFLTNRSTRFLVTPDQLLQPGFTTVSSSQSSQKMQRDVEVVQVSSSVLPVPKLSEPRESILPRSSPLDCNLSGVPLHPHHKNRGHGRVRGNRTSRYVTKYAEDFDFIAMNKKFNKDEVWGHLGKAKKTQEGGDDCQDEDGTGPSKFEIKPVYIKDDFFDSLSCHALDRGSNTGRTKFCEQMKIDTETFGHFVRHRGGRGLGRGGHSRGAYYGRSYGYNRRGRGYWT